MAPQDHIVIFITAGDIEEARLISLSLLEQKLAACVNIAPGIESHFRWGDKIESESESLLIVKTRGSLLTEVIDTVKKLHSYDIPEVIALPVIGGNRDYLDWIGQETLKGEESDA